MKTTKNILILALAGLFFVSCKEANTKAENTDAVQTKEILAENLQTASFTVDGMHCEFGCAKSIEKKLAKLDGVKSANVNFETKEASVEYDATQQTPQVLAKIVEEMADGNTYIVSEVKSTSDQSVLFSDKEKEKKKKDKKKAKKGEKPTESSAPTTTQEKPAEKKGGCCSGKSSCSSKSGSI